MNKQKILLAMTFFLLMLMSACQHDEIRVISSFSKDENRITAEEFNDKFRIEYGLKNLEKHEIYFENGYVQTEFYFDEPLEQWQKDSVYLFAMNTFIYKKTSAISVWHVYDAIANNELNDIGIEGLSLFIYCDGRLVSYQMYSSEGKQIVHLINE